MATNHMANVLLARCSQDNSGACLSLSLARSSCSASLPYPSSPSAGGYPTERGHSGEGLSREGSLVFSRLVTDLAVDQLQSLE